MTSTDKPLRIDVYAAVSVVLVAVVALAAWHLTAIGLKLPPALLPTPGDVLQAAINSKDELTLAWLSTGVAASCGLLCAIALGTMISVLFSQSRRIRLAFFPYVLFLQTVPIVAIAPLLIIWSGYQLRTVIIVTVIVCLFPIVNSVTAGLTSIDRQLSDLFRLYDANRYQRLIRLQLPSALGHLVVGAKTSSGLAVIGAIVAEFFVGNGTAYNGLGTLMTEWQGFLKTDRLIAAVFSSTLLGLVLFGSVQLFATLFLRRWMK